MSESKQLKTVFIHSTTSITPFIVACGLSPSTSQNMTDIKLKAYIKKNKHTFGRYDTNAYKMYYTVKCTFKASNKFII